MGKLRRIPLEHGLLVSETNFIQGQLEVTLVNYSDVEIVINRKPYGARSDVKFSLTKKALHCMIDILTEAEEKLEKYWLSEFAINETKTAKAAKEA
jgi:hypothetical protein